MNKILLQDVRSYIMDSYGLSDVETMKVLNTYGQVLGETLSQLKESVNNKNNAVAGRHAHSLKGALLNLGLAELAHEASRLEKEFHKGVEEEHFQRVDNFFVILQDIATTIQVGSSEIQ